MASTSRNAVLKAEHVQKVYSGGDVQFKALKGINLEVKEGEYTSIMGKSGSGKSTLLHILGCLDRPTSGKLFIDGHDVSLFDDNGLAVLRGKKIGFVFQQFFLVPSINIVENVALPQMILGIPKEERIAKAKRVLEKVGLEGRFRHKPQELSGGERQRVAIARALVNDPAIILADEPTGNLDSKVGAQILDIFEGLHEEGKTVVVVTHDEDIVKRTDRTIWLKDGFVERETLHEQPHRMGKARPPRTQK